MKKQLFHGSDHIIETPIYGVGKKHNDYGQGFYCTEDIALAKEWAVSEEKDGYVNEYEIETNGLHILNINDGSFTLLHWMGLLLNNRAFVLATPLEREAKRYITDCFPVPLAGVDVIIGYRADAVNNYAIHYLHKYQGENPFFLFISQIEPHHQNDHGRFEGPDGSKELFGNFTPPGDMTEGEGDWKENYPDYLGQCHSLDKNVGYLVDTLKEKGLWENTILFYTSDHGCHFCTRNSEYKRSCHESSIHIPLIATGGSFTGGKRIQNLVSLIDLPVTLLDCAGIPKPEDFQGHSLRNLVEGKVQEWQECVFVQISESQVGRAIRTRKWKYSVVAEEDPWECPGADVYYEQYLYDLEKDPFESVNLVRNPVYRDIRGQLAEKLKECMKRAGEKIPEIRPYQE